VTTDRERLKSYALMKSETFLRWLEEQGITPAHCRRVVMDFEVGAIVHIYVEQFGTEALMVNPPDFRGFTIKETEDLPEAKA
jgi:hypothetical protein